MQVYMLSFGFSQGFPGGLDGKDLPAVQVTWV